MSNIHPTAIISPKAKLGENITVGPFSLIEDDVEIGDNTYIGPQVCIYSGARIGNNVKIYQSASISHKPQDLKFGNEETHCFVGDGTTIHEFVTLHRGTKETRKTEIGKNVLLMAYTHVAHDSYIGDNCILANGVQIAGHVHVDEFAIIGGMTPVHQFCFVGRHSMIGGAFRVVQNVPPYIMAAGEPLKYGGLNVIGLRRRGFKSDQIETIKKIYTYIYNSQLNLTQAKEKIAAEFGDSVLAVEILEFLSKGNRGIMGK
jgi:UDP-N-acetylglucosamine acyltransferase